MAPTEPTEVLPAPLTGVVALLAGAIGCVAVAVAVAVAVDGDGSGAAVSRVPGVRA